MLKSARKIYTLAANKVHSPWASFWLATLFLLEIALFIPLDALLMLFCIERPPQAFFYALVAAIFSTLSGLVGFCMGLLLWDTAGTYLVSHFIGPHFFERLVQHYQSYQTIALLCGAFLPLPFKVPSSARIFFIHYFYRPFNAFFLCCLFNETLGRANKKFRGSPFQSHFVGFRN
jgi:membrane protein YqaA with SNARE-associated domain